MTSTNRIRVAATLFWLGVSLANSARAVDLRDWGRRYDNASERFVVLSQFNNDDVLDKETQLVWRRSAMRAVSRVSALNNCYASGTGDLARAKILSGYNYISSKSKDESWPYLCVRGVGVTGR